MTSRRDFNQQVTAPAEALVRQVVQLLRTDTDRHDAITLLGPEKFAVLLQDCLSEYALQVARLMRTAIQNSLLRWQEDTVKFGINIGLVLFSRCGDKTALLIAADEACRSAKERGHNSIHSVRFD
jgi:diguanylate cyclase (GGDEF)-like protein